MRGRRRRSPSRRVCARGSRRATSARRPRPFPSLRRRRRPPSSPRVSPRPPPNWTRCDPGTSRFGRRAPRRRIRFANGSSPRNVRWSGRWSRRRNASRRIVHSKKRSMPRGGRRRPREGRRRPRGGRRRPRGVRRLRRRRRLSSWRPKLRRPRRMPGRNSTLSGSDSKSTRNSPARRSGRSPKPRATCGRWKVSSRTRRAMSPRRIAKL